MPLCWVCQWNDDRLLLLVLVPITELKPDSVQPASQTLVEKVSFDQQYNSRNPNNYPLRGRVGH